ncbi:unnamed protein product [Vitrella brassicaformis CCMP3155]|uniref:Uncharacterized protein n=1 Tax=Vitrella brassicaformis (strain CCMP3155) TaxID=1169540 RepID=A0A0G4EUY0_VITBC|nr:unnamed protein product [Vitrella brassicaformis CCMP3155]|eukprot:CEM02059.1 unnamed protein product [Vitrella brassicaformis CCMP3155]
MDGFDAQCGRFKSHLTTTADVLQLRDVLVGGSSYERFKQAASSPSKEHTAARGWAPHGSSFIAFQPHPCPPTGVRKRPRTPSPPPRVAGPVDISADPCPPTATHRVVAPPPPAFPLQSTVLPSYHFQGDRHPLTPIPRAARRPHSGQSSNHGSSAAPAPQQLLDDGGVAARRHMAGQEDGRDIGRRRSDVVHHVPTFRSSGGSVGASAAAAPPAAQEGGDGNQETIFTMVLPRSSASGATHSPLTPAQPLCVEFDPLDASSHAQIRSLMHVFPNQPADEDMLRHSPQVLSIALGRNFVAVRGSNGGVTIVRDGQGTKLGFLLHPAPAGPSARSHIPILIEQIAAGHDHLIAMDQHGAVWAWGSNRKGQCGLRTHVTDNEIPRLVVDLLARKERATKVAAGQHCSACVTRSGTPFFWGQLPNDKVRRLPAAVSVRRSDDKDGKPVRFRDVTISPRGTYALIGGCRRVKDHQRQGGWLWTGGTNDTGQTCNPPSPPLLPPSLVLHLWRHGFSITHVSIGGDRTLACDVNGRLFGWGAFEDLTGGTQVFDRPQWIANDILAGREAMQATVGVRINMLLLDGSELLGFQSVKPGLDSFLEPCLFSLRIPQSHAATPHSLAVAQCDGTAVTLARYRSGDTAEEDKGNGGEKREGDTRAQPVMAVGERRGASMVQHEEAKGTEDATGGFVPLLMWDNQRGLQEVSQRIKQYERMLRTDLQLRRFM